MDVRDFTILLDEDEGKLTLHAESFPPVRGAKERLDTKAFHRLVAHAGLLRHEADNGFLSREAGAVAGRDLFRTIFSDKLLPSFQEAIRITENHGEILRLVLKYELPEAGTHQMVNEVPWELLFNPERGQFVALDEQFLLVRHLQNSGQVWRPLESPPRILISEACPLGEAPLATEEEAQAVHAVCERLYSRGLVGRSIRLPHVSEQRLVQQFNHADDSDEHFHIWHHCGHGRGSMNGAFRLALHARDGDGTSGRQYSNPGTLDQIVADHPELRLIILNVCEGAGRRGLAAAAAALNIPATIGFHATVRDHCALGFAEALWRGIASTRLDHAVRDARRTLACGTAALDFARIVLFLRSLDPPCLINNTVLARNASGRI